MATQADRRASARARDRKARQRVADLILPIVFNTTISRSVAITEPAEDIPALTAQMIAANIRTWVLIGDWLDRPLCDREFEAMARADVLTLLAENKKLRAQVAQLTAQPATPSEPVIA